MVILATSVAILGLLVTLVLQVVKFFAKGNNYKAKSHDLERKHELCVFEQAQAEARIVDLEKKVGELQREIPLLSKEVGVAEARLREAEQRLRHRTPTRHTVGNE